MGSMHKILAVDDNATNLAIIEETLGEDYDLQVAPDGEQALALAEHFRPDLVLLDIMMPGIDGYETCRRMRAEPAMRGAKIILVSAKNMLDDRLTGYESGADDYVTKPFDPEELLAKVQVYLRLKSAEEVHQLKSRVISALGHQILTPLNDLIVPADILASEEEIDPQKRKMLGKAIRKCSEHLYHIFERVMTISAMKNGDWDFLFANTDLCKVVRDATAAVASRASQRHVRIDQQLTEPITMMLDHSQMEVAVAFLLGHAVQLSQEGGHVAVNVSLAGKNARLTITSSGEGAAADAICSVFEEDFDESTSGDDDGNLSLLLAKQIISAHHGSIIVENEPRRGTAFVIQLPIAEPVKSADVELNMNLDDLVNSLISSGAKQERIVVS